MFSFQLHLITDVLQSSLLCQFEEAAREVADEITRPRPDGETEVEDIQVCLISNANPANIRDLKVIILS